MRDGNAANSRPTSSPSMAVESGRGSGAIAKLRRWWLQRDRTRRALAALDADQLGNLSETGQQSWREARRGNPKDGKH